MEVPSYTSSQGNTRICDAESIKNDLRHTPAIPGVREVQTSGWEGSMLPVQHVWPRIPVDSPCDNFQVTAGEAETQITHSGPIMLSRKDIPDRMAPNP